MRRELHQLSAALKKSVPFHSPRYLGHMVSDLLLPGLAAQILTLPYNPNNVSEDAAPVTVDLEVQVGLQLARMLGYPHDTARADCAFGHLTSGGTLANYQALRLALALKAFPVALRAAGVPDLDAAATTTGPPSTSVRRPAPRCSIAGTTGSRRCRANEAPRSGTRRVQAQRLEQLGLVDFFARHPAAARAQGARAGHRALLVEQGPEAARPRPRAAAAAARARHAARCGGAAKTTLQHCLRERQPVLMAVAVLGTTEYGTIDPVDAVVAARDRCADAGSASACMSTAPGAVTSPPCSATRTAACAPATEVRGDFATSRSRRCMPPSPHWGHRLGHGRPAQARLPAVRRRRVRVPRPPRDGAARRGGRLRVPWRAMPADYLARFRQPRASSSPRAPSPAPPPPRSMSPTRCCRSTMPTSACCRADHRSRPRPSTSARSHSRASSATWRMRWCHSRPTATWSAWPSIRAATATWRAPARSCAACTPNCAATRSQPLQLKQFFGSITTLRPEALGAAETQRIAARARARPGHPSAASDDRSPGDPAPHADEPVPDRPRERHQLHRPLLRVPRHARARAACSGPRMCHRRPACIDSRRR